MTRHFLRDDDLTRLSRALLPERPRAVGGLKRP